MKIRDQLGRELHLKERPKRIVSVVPSQTEYLYYLGLDEYIVGQTVFCIHPKDKFNHATKVGGTKRLHIEKIRELKPDLIIANKEENEQYQIETLEKEFPVWISDIKNLDDALNMMRALGGMFDRENISNEITDKITREFNSVKRIASIKKVLYLIWNQPWMAAGRDTFINAMLEFAGFENAIQDEFSRYPQFNDEEIKTLNPDVILLSSEPYPFKKNHMDNIRKICPKAQVALVDGEMFSWYGNRLVFVPEYFQQVRESLNL